MQLSYVTIILSITVFNNKSKHALKIQVKNILESFPLNFNILIKKKRRARIDNNKLLLLKKWDTKRRSVLLMMLINKTKTKRTNTQKQEENSPAKKDIYLCCSRYCRTSTVVKRRLTFSVYSFKLVLYRTHTVIKIIYEFVKQVLWGIHTTKYKFIFELNRLWKFETFLWPQGIESTTSSWHIN